MTIMNRILRAWASEPNRHSSEFVVGSNVWREMIEHLQREAEETLASTMRSAALFPGSDKFDETLRYEREEIVRLQSVESNQEGHRICGRPLRVDFDADPDMIELRPPS